MFFVNPIFFIRMLKNKAQNADSRVLTGPGPLPKVSSVPRS